MEFVRKQYSKRKDLPILPVVETLPSNAGDASLIPGWGTKIPQAMQPKKPKQNRSNTVTNSIQTFKKSTSKKKKFKNKLINKGTKDGAK